ncbi:type IV pili twitching motility protein PilT [Candidatus Falkowbacteria bacterium RBG_13_39_14]|uniref:Type IV pili twitching motility protein PilT n=1 Tax=Candidatus Falkowbacteria bacterium RBG_13_39_14 TaxID=1797985 RepID=A0A1F5S5L6_9BACT|nr:MAG: type IV pili twitching motility protein PilT [Candidatus Falkowbacteria bacterium RBG_13_39_14]
MTINEIFKIGVDKKASDIHLIVGKPPIIRVDGELFEIKSLPILNEQSMKKLVYAILSEKQREVFEKNKELDISYEIPNAGRFRVNAHWEKQNVGLVARIINFVPPSMEEISMPEIIYKLARLKQGLVIFTGPTGCGKSTSLAAMINLINNERSCHIMTIEDPIEFIYASNKSIIKQRQMNTDVLSFREGLKHVLRQDPNVVMVGEMRDLETIAATITLAETGHLVLATLHTYSAAQTVDRIIDIFPPYQQFQIRMQLSMTLAGVVSQRLLPRQNGGRVATREVLINTPAVSNMIRENKIAQIGTVIQTSADEGMQSLDQDIKRLYKEEVLAKEVAQSYMINPDSLED